MTRRMRDFILHIKENSYGKFIGVNGMRLYLAYQGKLVRRIHWCQWQETSISRKLIRRIHCCQCHETLFCISRRTINYVELPDWNPCWCGYIIFILLTYSYIAYSSLI